MLSAIVVSIFILGYLAIAVEYYVKVNKTASAILMAVLCWMVLFVSRGNYNLEQLDLYIGDASQIIFFLMGAMTLVEMIDSHKGFNIITDIIKTKSKRKLLWLVGIMSFFLSAILDNLTTTIVMVSLLRKLIKDPKDRMLLGATVVIASNAGGAWTPIGDVTTTMLWIKGQVTSLKVMRSLFIPSVCSLLVSLFLLGLPLKGNYSLERVKETKEPGAKLVFSVGILALVFVPIFRFFTNLPPFMGMLIGLGILWIITDILHYRYENRHHLRVPYVLTKIDTSGVLFFLGILLTINSLEILGILKNVAAWLDSYVGNLAAISTSIGFLSAIVDNVPLVAACMSMYDLSTFPPDSSLWHMIAYTAGTGGSILLIGSTAGVALMGLEKVDFLWYAKKISITAIAGYLAGMAVYLLLNAI